MAREILQLWVASRQVTVQDVWKILIFGAGFETGVDEESVSCAPECAD